MISNCTTCPGFSFCENPNKLGRFFSSDAMPSITIKYDLDEESMLLSTHVARRVNKQLYSKHTDDERVDEHPLESWEDTNPERLPRYGMKSSNIFLQLQEQPLLGSTPEDNEDENLIYSTSLFLSLPPPDDLPVDGSLAAFFSSRMDTFLGFEECFSSAYKSLYLLSANNRVLRHVLFAFIKYLNEQDRLLQSVACSMHLQSAIPQLQRSLTFLDFDDGDILSIPLLAYLAFWWREFDVAKSHLRGFYRMLLHVGYLEQDDYGKTSVSATMPSLVLLMWRACVKLDRFFGFMRPDEETLPPIKSTPVSSQRYILDFIDPSSLQWTEYLVLMDELEDLRNLAAHYDRRARAVRQATDYTAAEAQRYIEQASKKIIRKVEQLEGKILAASNAYDAVFNPQFAPSWEMTVEPFPAAQFLHYMPLFKSLHHRFIEALLVNRATLIHTTITSHPRAGPYPQERLLAAIEICCAYSTLKERKSYAIHGRGNLLEALLYAGFAFASPSHVLGTAFLEAVSDCRISMGTSEAEGGGGTWACRGSENGSNT